MNSLEPKKQHGGARVGAGAKARPGGPSKSWSVTLPADLNAFLIAQAGNGKGAVVGEIERILRAHMETHLK